jgi:molybdopterin converting factor subunit 1
LEGVIGLQVQVLFFASMAGKTGVSRWVASLQSNATLADMKNVLADTFPACTDLLPICHIFVNQEYARGNPALNDTDEIAIFPPVSGGGVERGRLDPLHFVNT